MDDGAEAALPGLFDARLDLGAEAAGLVHHVFQPGALDRIEQPFEFFHAQEVSLKR
jgi:hypothetical protein